MSFGGENMKRGRKEGKGKKGEEKEKIGSKKVK
jgi:hypothetical protein